MGVRAENDQDARRRGGSCPVPGSELAEPDIDLRRPSAKRPLSPTCFDIDTNAPSPSDPPSPTSPVSVLRVSVPPALRSSPSLLYPVMPSREVTIAIGVGATAFALVAGYAAYFDYKRQTDREFRRKLRESETSARDAAQGSLDAAGFDLRGCSGNREPSRRPRGRSSSELQEEPLTAAYPDLAHAGKDNKKVSSHVEAHKSAERAGTRQVRPLLPADRPIKLTARQRD